MEKTLKKLTKSQINWLIMQLSDMAHDMEIDRENIIDEYGFDGVETLKSLVKFLESLKNE